MKTVISMAMKTPGYLFAARVGTSAMSNPAIAAITQTIWAFLNQNGRIGEFSDNYLTDEDIAIDASWVKEYCQGAMIADLADEQAEMLVGFSDLADWDELTGRLEEMLEI